MTNKNVLFVMALLCCLFSTQILHAQCTAAPGSLVNTPDGANRVYTCPGDNQPDVVEFANNGASAANYAYAITDQNNIILMVTTDSSLDFEGAGTGLCRVFGFSYNGNITAQAGDLVYSTKFSDNCWFISNNAIEVVRSSVEGGTVATPDNRTTVYTCLDDGIPDFVGFTTTSTSNALYRYVITDDQNNILGIPPTNFLDFAGAGVGDCRVWGLSYTGNLTAGMGDNAATTALSDGCFELSSNFINVVRNSTDGGTVSTPDGMNRLEICAGDGQADVVEFAHVTSSTANYAYAITDQNNNILMVTNNTSQDFEGAGGGLCRVFGFSYTGEITAEAGDLVYSTKFSNGCYQISSNAIEVVRTLVDGGTVSMPSGATVRYTCPGDGVDDVISFVHENDAPNAQYAYVITDDQNNILGIPPSNSQNFEGAGSGVCRVWGLSYTGSITAGMGDNATAVPLSDGCFALSSNFIEVIRDTPDGGTVSTPDGETEVSVCAGDGIDDLVGFQHVSSSMAAYRYVITDDQNIILGTPPPGTMEVNFDGAGPGVCRIWGLSYTGMFMGEMGDDAAAIDLSNDCFELSSNFITVIRTEVDGGTVSMPSGATVRYTCPGDGVDDVISFVHENDAPGTEYAYVITDDQNNILGIPPSNSQNFEGAGSGVCRVWGLSYTGNITAGMGDNATAVPLTDGCFELSSNFIEVIRDTPDGGTVSTPDGETEVSVCAGDGIDDLVGFQHVSSSMAAYRYVITDDQNIILGTPPPGTTEVNFDGAGPGVCRIWGLSYTGMFMGEMGDNAAAIDLSNDCFELSSNFITVIRTEVDGGTVSMPSGATVRYTCPGDGVDDVISFVHENDAPGTEYAYVITDDQNNILGIPPSNSQNFEGAGSGVCRVWGLSYTGNITAGMGDNATAVPLTDGCFELSENFIEVIRDTPDGGTVSTPDGATEVSVCAGDGIDDLVGFQHVSSSMAAYRYVITDDQNIILGTPPPGATEVNFDGAGPGVCRIWGLSYTGMFMGEMGDDAAAIDLSNDCFELSSNFITVIRTEVDGGTVSMPSGATVRYTCPGDGVDDVIMFVHENDAPGTEYAYVITDDQNNILGIPPSNSQNFEGAGSGVCRVWGLSYTGSITAGMGDNATAVPLTDGCFELSENFIEVIRDTPDGGTVSTTDDETEVTICAGDGDDDIISVQHETSSMAAFRYIVTDDQNNILATPPAGTTELNLEGAGPGICRIWGLSFTGMFAAEVGQNAGQADLSSDCFELSENFVTVIRVDSGAPCDGNFAPPVVGNQNFQGLNLPSAIQGLNLSPNPVVADLNLQFEHNGLAQRYQIAVFNTAGQLITEQVYEANDGSNTYELDLQQAEPGFYILQMVGEDGNRMSRKFIKSIK